MTEDEYRIEAWRAIRRVVALARQYDRDAEEWAEYHSEDEFRAAACAAAVRCAIRIAMRTDAR